MLFCVQMNRLEGEQPFFVSRTRVDVKEGGADLPQGAVKFTDPATRWALAMAQIETIHFFVDTGQGQCINGLPETPAFAAFKQMSFPPDVPKSWMSRHPEVEGYEWFKGYQVKVGRGRLLLFTGWMHPHIEGGAPDPIIYTVGDPSQNLVRAVAVGAAYDLIDFIQTSRVRLKRPKSPIAKIAARFPYYIERVAS